MGILNWLIGKKEKKSESSESIEELDPQKIIDDSNKKAMEMFKEFEELNVNEVSNNDQEKQNKKDYNLNGSDFNNSIDKEILVKLDSHKSINLKELVEKNHRFVAVDVETANSQKGSICQIGMALVSMDGQISTIGIEVNPEQPFDAVSYTHLTLPTNREV